MDTDSSHALNFLWVLDIDYSTRHHHGATLRYINYSRQLIAAGHRVYFIVRFQNATIEEGTPFLEELKRAGTISGYHAIAYTVPRNRGRLAAMALFPPMANHILAPQQWRMYQRCRDISEELEIDVCILSDRDLFFLAPRFRRRMPTIIDFGDCWTLYRARELRFLWQRRQYSALRPAVRQFVEWLLKERYYSRTADANITVSPVDKAGFERLSRRAANSHVLLNGVTPGGIAKADKVKGRLIFSGNMDFPPNYESALWLIDHVMPLVFAAHPDAHLVIAGANPVPELLARASDRIRITGFVPDMSAEIASASLYVAPMILGGGFKNKVVEALINRTYVAGTPMAVEFMTPESKAYMLIADSAEALAAHVNHFLARPDDFESQLTVLHAMMLREFSWQYRTAELLNIVRDVLEERRPVLYAARTPASSSAK